MASPSDLAQPVLAAAATQLGDILVDVDNTVVDPDYCSGETLTCYRGNPLAPLHVAVDYLGNAFHMVRDSATYADEHYTITYLPSWFAAVLRRYVPVHLGGLTRRRNHEVCLSAPVDRDQAVPVEIEVTVKTALPRDTFLIRQTWLDFEPTRVNAVTRRGTVNEPPDVADLDRVHWNAPNLRLIAAPGVEIRTRYLFPAVGSWDWSQIPDLPFGEAAMVAARFVDNTMRLRLKPVSTCEQALAVAIERRQDAASLGQPGGARRETGLSEVELLPPATAGLRFEESTRPDGVDLLLLTAKAAVAALPFRLDEALRSAAGFLGPDLPVPVRIRVDPGSATDRYAYTVCYLDDHRRPVSDPARASRTGPPFRIAVIRTGTTKVYVDTLVGGIGGNDVLEYRERVVPFGQVPLAITDNGESLPVKHDGLPGRPVTPGDVLDAVQLVLGLLPFPPCQVLADAGDYANLLSYAATGKDLAGREFTGLDAALTLGGLLVPHILEPLVGELKRLILGRDGALDRLVAALGMLRPEDLELANSAIKALE